MSSTQGSAPNPPPFLRPGAPRSTRSLGRGSSPQWKNHYTTVAKLWGSQSMASNMTSPEDSMSRGELWQEVKEQRKRGVYPYTHLSHKQEEEVWIDPLSLPKDITIATLKRKEIPREWFHLPSGIEPPTTNELLKESSSDDEEGCSSTAADLHPSRICGRGRSRSKSKEKKLNKTIKKEQITKRTGDHLTEKRQKKQEEEEKRKSAEVQFPGPPVPPKFSSSREPYPLPQERFTESEDDGEYELDTRWTAFRTEGKRKSRSRSRDASKKSPKSPRLLSKAATQTPPPPLPRANTSYRKEPDDGGYEPVGRLRKSFCGTQEVCLGKDKGKAYEDLSGEPPERLIDLPFTKGGARISKKDFITVESSTEEKEEGITVPLEEALASTQEVLEKKEPLSLSTTSPEEEENKKVTELSKKEQKRLEKERVESEKKAKKEKEKLVREEQERLKKLKKDQEKVFKQDAERLKKEKKEQEKAEKHRIAKEKKENKGPSSKSDFGSLGRKKGLNELKGSTETHEETSGKSPVNERSPTFFTIPAKPDETTITKTKVVVDIKEIPDGERDPFVDYLAPKFREKEEKQPPGSEAEKDSLFERSEIYSKAGHILQEKLAIPGPVVPLTTEPQVEAFQPSKLQSKVESSPATTNPCSSSIDESKIQTVDSKELPLKTATKDIESSSTKSVTKASESSSPEVNTLVKGTESSSPEVNTLVKGSDSSSPEVNTLVKGSDSSSSEIKTVSTAIEPSRTEVKTVLTGVKSSLPEVKTEPKRIESTFPEVKTEPNRIETHSSEVKAAAKGTESSSPTVKIEAQSSWIEFPVNKSHVKKPSSAPSQTPVNELKLTPGKSAHKTDMATETTPLTTQVVAKTKAEIDFDRFFQPPSLKTSSQVKVDPVEDLNKIEVMAETSSQTRKYSDRKSSFLEYDEDQDLIYDPSEEKLDAAFQERLEHLLQEEMEESIPGEVPKLSKKEKKELKKLEREKRKADKVDKEQTLKEQRLQDRLEKQMIAREKKDLVVAEKERKKVERDWLKQEKKQAKLEKEEEKKQAKLEKEEEKKQAKLEKKKKQPKRSFFKVLQNRGKAKSLSDLNENDPLIIKEYHLNEEENQEEEEGCFQPRPDEEDENTKKETKEEPERIKKEENNMKTMTTKDETIEKKASMRATEGKSSPLPLQDVREREDAKGTKSEKIYESTTKGRPGKEKTPVKDTVRSQPEPQKEEVHQHPEAEMAGKVVPAFRDDFAAFQRQSGAPHQEEEIDFTPQNGYVLDERAMEDMGYIAVDEDVEEEAKHKRKSRERRNFKVGLQKSVSNFNSKIRNARLPSPHELREGIMNSNLHKSFQQPLVSRSRVENVDVQKARALLVKHNTPSELAKMKHPLDIPLPKFGGGENKPEKPPRPEQEEPDNNPKAQNGFSGERPESRSGGKMYQTLPRSWRETQLITAIKENGDPSVLVERQELVRSKTPSELAQFHSITDFPVPSRLTNLFHPQGNEQSKGKNQSSTSIDKPKEPFKMENMIPTSLRETKLITNVRQITDEETLRSRQNLVQQNTPGELAKFKSLSDFPVPTRIENIFKARSRSSSASRKNTKERRASSASGRSRSLTRSLSGTLPRSWRETQLLTGVKVDPNQEEIVRRRALIENTSPAELSKITSVADLPVPTALQNIFSGKGEKAEKDNNNNEEKISKPMNLEEMYNNLPRSLKTELLVKCVENDQERTKKHQKLVESMKPSDLAAIGSLSEFPIPSVLENIFKEKDSTATPRPEKRARNKTVIGLMSYESMPESLKKEVLVRSKVEEDPEVLKERRELVESKTPAELSRIGGFSDFPLPERLEGIVRPSRRNLKSTKEKDMAKKRSKSWSSLTNPKELYKSLPDSLKSEVLVSVTVENEDTLKEHKKLVEENSVSELAQIHGFSDFPVPDTIVNLIKSDPNKASVSRPDTPAKSLKENFMDAIPDSLKSDLLVRSKTEDPELLRERQELTRSKTPNELSQISSISDFPIPTSVENMFKRKEMDPNEPVAPPRRWKKENIYESLPSSLKSEVLVRSKVEEDPETLRVRQELVRSKSPAELSEIHGLEDIPIPSFLTKRKPDSSPDESSKKEDEEPKSLYDKMPDSLKMEMLVRSRVETPEIQKERSELVKAKTVKELSEINGLEDIPMPNLQFLRKKKDENEQERGPQEKKSLYEQMPESLKTEVLVRACVEDPIVTAANASLVKSKSVKELSEIRGLSDIPLPTRLEYVIGRKPRPVERRKKFREKQRSQSAKNLHERMYGSIPQSLKSELLVKSVFQDSELQMERRRLVQSKSVGELSQIHSLSDFPVPSVIERFVSSSRAMEDGVESSPLSRMSNISLSRKSLYSALPKSLTTQDCLVRSRVENPEVLKERRETVRTKSVSELATLNSISDFPIPSNVERFIQNRRAKSVDTSKILLSGDESSRPTSPLEKLRDSIPSSMKTELLVSSSVQDPETSQKRKQLTETTSVHELSQLHGLSDFPVPDTLENFVKGRLSRNENRGEDEGEEKSGHIDLYASLPKSLKQEVLVRSVVQEGDEDLLKKKALAESKSPTELSQIHSFSEIPVPSRIEAWLSSTDESKLGHPVAPPRSTRSFHELRENMYETLPKSLKDPALVRTKVEDPEIQKSRSELTRSKTPSQLAEIHGINEIPIPGLWNDGTPKKNSRSNVSLNAVPKTKQEIKDYVYKALFPESLVRPCIVRSKVEDQERLLERQAIQQSKTIHELSKINNLSDFPLPGNMKLPPIPLPSTKGLLKMITPNRNKSKTTEEAPASTNDQNQLENQYNQVEESPYDHSGITDDEMLRYESSTPAESLIREQDFGYEVISAAEIEAREMEEKHRETDILNINQIPDKFKDDMREPSPRLPEATHVEDEEDSQLVDHYRGTPPRALGRSKMKNKKNRQSQDSFEGEQVVERIQSRPLPAPPTPVRSRGKSAIKRDAQTGTVEVPPGASREPLSAATSNTEVFHTVQSSLDQTLVKSWPSYDFEDETLADSVVDSMHSCAETLVDEDNTLHEDLRDEDVFNSEPYPRTGSVEERLKNETHDLSRELLEHVENLRTTLGNMSNRLGTTSPEPRK